MEFRLLDKPQLLIVGGPNGSGKTTVAMKYATAEGIPYIGADAIAASLAPDDPTSARIEAGRQFIQSVDGLQASALASWNRRCPDDHSAIAFTQRATMAMRSPSSLYSSIRSTFALHVSPSGFAKVVTMFLKQISGVATFAAWGISGHISGHSIAISPIAGSCCTMEEANYKTSRLVRDRR